MNFEVDRDRLIKILRMFGSSHDGEVASAARRAHELIRSRSLDWDDLIIQVTPSTSHSSRSSQQEQTQRPPPPHELDEAEMIRRCSERNYCLTSWEKEFIASVGLSIVEWGRLTPKQRSVLDRIVNKLKLLGEWM